MGLAKGDEARQLFPRTEDIVQKGKQIGPAFQERDCGRGGGAFLGQREGAKRTRALIRLTAIGRSHGYPMRICSPPLGVILFMNSHPRSTA